MSEFDAAPPDDTPEAPASIDEVQVELQFVSGHRSLQLGQLRRLAQGAVIELDRLTDARVEIQVNGVLIGRGELVDIDGRLAVEIIELCRST